MDAQSFRIPRTRRGMSQNGGSYVGPYEKRAIRGDRARLANARQYAHETTRTKAAASRGISSARVASVTLLAFCWLQIRPGIAWGNHGGAMRAGARGGVGRVRFTSAGRRNEGRRSAGWRTVRRPGDGRETPRNPPSLTLSHRSCMEKPHRKTPWRAFVKSRFLVVVRCFSAWEAPMKRAVLYLRVSTQNQTTATKNASCGRLLSVPAGRLFKHGYWEQAKPCFV